MPSLIRFLTVIGAFAALCFAALFSLATFVEPRPREMTVTIPAQRLKPQPVETVARNPQTAGAEPAAEAPQTR